MDTTLKMNVTVCVLKLLISVYIVYHTCTLHNKDHETAGDVSLDPSFRPGGRRSVRCLVKSGKNVTLGICVNIYTPQYTAPATGTRASFR